MREADVQRQIVSYLKYMEAQGKLLWQRNNTGGNFHRKDGSFVHIEGAPPGSADLLVFLPGGRVIHVEVKSPTGRLSKPQMEWREKLCSIGHSYYVVRSLDEFYDVMRKETSSEFAGLLF